MERCLTQGDKRKKNCSFPITVLFCAITLFIRNATCNSCGTIVNSTYSEHCKSEYEIITIKDTDAEI